MDAVDECYDNKPATVGDLKLNLPLDEDDYLMPSPQQTETTTTYMDIIGENKSSGRKSEANPLVTSLGEESLSTNSFLIFR